MSSKKRRRRLLRPSSAGGGSYSADAVHFDGQTTYLKTDSLTCADSGLMSFAFSQRLVSVGLRTAFFASDPQGNYVTYGLLQSQLDINWSDSDGSRNFSTAWREDEEDPVISSGEWVSFLGTVDANKGAGLKVAKYYTGDTLLELEIEDTQAAFNIVLNGLPFYFGSDGRINSSELEFADVWIAPGQSLLVDGDIPLATRRKFFDASGKPVYLGESGEIPTGVAPAIFFSGNATGFATNRGTGGAFTLVGALTNASTSPSD